METKEQQKEYSPRAAAEAGAWLTLVDPDGVPVKKKLHLMGSDSDAYMEKAREIQRRNSREMERARKIKLSSPEQQESDQLELLIAATKGWEGDFTASFSGDAARAFYRERPDYKEQAELFVHDRASFFRRAASS